MKIKKAIAKSLPFVIFLTTIALILYFILPYPFLKHYLFVFLLILYCYPLVIYLFYIKRWPWLLIEFFIFIFLLGIFFIFFRKIRDALPPSIIGKSAVVGYAQYFGYPFYLDAVVFFIILLHPVLVFLLLKFFEKLERRKV